MGSHSKKSSETSLHEKSGNKLNIDSDKEIRNNLKINDKNEISDIKVDEIKIEVKIDHEHELDLEEKDNKSHFKKSSETSLHEKSGNKLNKDIDIDTNIENVLNIDSDKEI